MWGYRTLSISSYWSHCCPLNIAADMIGVTEEEYMIKKQGCCTKSSKIIAMGMFSSMLANSFLAQQ